MTRKEEINVLKNFKNTILKKYYERQIGLEAQKRFAPSVQGKPKVKTLYKKN